MRTSLRIGSLIAALALSAASAGSNQQASEPPPAIGAGNAGPAGSQPMAEGKALGLWQSSFGAVRIERDPERPGAVRGIWLYDRNGQEVIGYFAGALSGTNFSFSWEEPTSSGSPLVGGGYLIFDASGRSFEGKWWTSSRDRGGDWSGWRNDNSSGPAEQAPDDDGGDFDDAPDSDSDSGDEGPEAPAKNDDFI